MEEKVILRIRKSDQKYVERILKDVASEYHDYLKNETEEEYHVNFELDSTYLENE